MSKRCLTLIEYNHHEFHPLVINNSWFLSHKEVATAFNTDIATIIESLDSLEEGKHYGYESVEYQEGKSTSSILFFSKIGIVRLAYFLKTDDALKFLEFVEEINLKEYSKDSAHHFYEEIEGVMEERLAKLKANPNASLEDINHFILTLDNLIKKRDGVVTSKSSGGSNITDIIETVVNLAQSYSVPKRK